VQVLDLLRHAVEFDLAVRPKQHVEMPGIVVSFADHDLRRESIGATARFQNGHAKCGVHGNSSSRTGRICPVLAGSPPDLRLANEPISDILGDASLNEHPRKCQVINVLVRLLEVPDGLAHQLVDVYVL